MYVNKSGELLVAFSAFVDNFKASDLYNTGQLVTPKNESLYCSLLLCRRCQDGLTNCLNCLYSGLVYLRKKFNLLKFVQKVTKSSSNG